MILLAFSEWRRRLCGKAFDLAVLHSRILALLRRANGTKAVKLSCDDLILDKEKAAVYYQQKEVALSQVRISASSVAFGKQRENCYQETTFGTDLG